ncbi:MAG: NAD-dependent epimerase/dehydratase family protein [Gemmatimonadales bacterium]
MSRLLVTGAAGFIGSHLCEALLAAGHEVTGLDNFDAFYPRAVKERNLTGLRSRPGFRFVEGDVGRDSLPLEGVEAILHLAARPGVQPSLEDPSGYMETNVTATARLLDQVRRTGIARVVFGSSSSVYGESTPPPFAEDAMADGPISPYAASKRAGELVCRVFTHLYSTRIACLRFFTVYGPRQRPDLAVHRFTARILAGQPILMRGDGSSERDYTYVSDVVDGILAALAWTERAGADGAEAWRVFNLGGGARVRLDRLIALIGAAAGRAPIIERGADQPGDVSLTAADLRRAERELGYRPKVGIEEGIRRFVSWYREAHGREP